MESLMVRAGACSPSRAPSLSALQIDSAIVVVVAAATELGFFSVLKTRKIF